MKRKPITKQNTFKRLAVDPNGRLIDATKDVTEQDTVRMQYHKLQSDQFDPVSEFEARNARSAYLFLISVLIMALIFVYLIIIHI